MNVTPQERLDLIDKGWKPPEQIDGEKATYILIGHLLTVMEKDKWYYLSQAGCNSMWDIITIDRPRGDFRKGRGWEKHGWKWSQVSSVMRLMYILDLVYRKDGSGNALVYKLKEKE